MTNVVAANALHDVGATKLVVEGCWLDGELAPVLVLVFLAAHGPGVDLGDRLRHRAGARDLAVVDRLDRADLGGGATDEGLFGDVEVAAGQVVDADVEPQVPGDRHDR